MNDLLSFDFGAQNVRVIVRDDAPWFVATDVASILGYRNAPDMVRNLDTDEADTHNLRSSGQNRDLSIISESGLYNAIFRSRRDEAKAFRKWVTGTVLPEIRRTGRFEANSRALGGPLVALPALLEAREAVLLPELCLALRIQPDPHALACLAGLLRDLGWRKAWVRATAIQRTPLLLPLGRGTKA